MKEEFLYYLWTYQLITSDLKTTANQKIRVISPGSQNTDSGPDFFNAMIEIGDTKWAGNVEIHVLSSDWYKHNHENNPSYDNIILHVVLTDDKPVHRMNKELIPTLELRNRFSMSILENYTGFLNSRNNIPCSNLIHNIKHFDSLSWFDALMAERLEKKSLEILDVLKLTKNNFLQVFYQRLARSFGYTANADAMELLASITPISLISKHNDSIVQIESLLFGQSGLLTNKLKDSYPRKLLKEYKYLKNKYNLYSMDNTNWKFMRMRPVSFPTIRISQFANIIYNSSGILNIILETDKLADIISLLSTSASPYWKDHYRFDKITPGKSKKLGLSSINIILINTIIPIMFVYGKVKNNTSLHDRALTWLSQIKPESNKITREFSSMGLKAENAMQSQAMIQLKNDYCSKKRCLGCRFGHILLNR